MKEKRLDEATRLCQKIEENEKLRDYLNYQIKIDTRKINRLIRRMSNKGWSLFVKKSGYIE